MHHSSRCGQPHINHFSLCNHFHHCSPNQCDASLISNDTECDQTFMHGGNQCNQTNILHANECNQTLIFCNHFLDPKICNLHKINQYGHDEKQQTCPVVVGFDSDQFIRYCDKVFSDFECNCTNFNDIFRELFQTGEVWCSHNLFLDAMENLSKYYGFLICT